MQTAQIIPFPTKAPVSKFNDGWTGRKCPCCKGTSYVPQTDFACRACGGTGEEYIAQLDHRNYD